MGLPVLRLVPFCVHAIATTSARPMEPHSLSYRPIDCGLPLKTGGSALALVVSRGLLSVYSRYGLHARQVAIATLYTEGSNGFVTSAAASIATGWSEPVPGRVCLPLWTNAFSRRTVFGNLPELVQLGLPFRNPFFTGQLAEIKWRIGETEYDQLIQPCNPERRHRDGRPKVVAG